MLYERAENLCMEIVNIKKRGIAVVFKGSTVAIKENVINYGSVPDKWTAATNTFLMINYIKNGNTLTDESDTSYLTQQKELVRALHPIADKADEEGYNDDRFFELCVKTLSNRKWQEGRALN